MLYISYIYEISNFKASKPPNRSHVTTILKIYLFNIKMICTKYINTHAFIKCDDNATRCAIVTLFLRKRCTISAAQGVQRG